jgi:hypothetical protein
MKMLLLVTVLCASWAQLTHAQIKLGNDATLDFATAEQGKKILTARDDFVRRMSPFDRAARLKTDREVSEKEYLAFVGKNVLAWTAAEKQKVVASFKGAGPELRSLSLPFPKKVLFIKTTGKEEGGAAYTRANAIVFPKDVLRGPSAGIRKTICHELFHVLSRANPDLRHKLYAAIGFQKCREVAFPSGLASRKITNPDAPKNDHCIRLKVDGMDQWVVPILFSRTEKYDTERGGEFFHYLEFRLLLVERKKGSSSVKPMYDGENPKLAGLHQVSGFFEQVGRNTGYIIHPEEILADNFALLVIRQGNLPSPEIIEKMKEILKKEAAGNRKSPPEKE